MAYHYTKNYMRIMFAWSRSLDVLSDKTIEITAFLWILSLFQSFGTVFWEVSQGQKIVLSDSWRFLFFLGYLNFIYVSIFANVRLDDVVRIIFLLFV